MIVTMSQSRTNPGSITHRCEGTSERACAVIIDNAGGRTRCSACRLEQQDIEHRRRSAISNSARRSNGHDEIRMRDGSTITARIKVTHGISGLPMIGLAKSGAFAWIVARVDGRWIEVNMNDIDIMIAEKNSRYLLKAEAVLKGENETS